jgi:DNA-binding NarL/FixJ family response regulator
MSRGPAILLIDAQSRYRADLRGLLEARMVGCQVEEALTALDVDGFGHIDVILMDEQSVPEVPTSMLRDMRGRNPELRIAVLTRSNRGADVLNFLSLGFDGVIYKFHADDCIIAAVLDLLPPGLSTHLGK